jgi:GTP-binding protein
MKKVKLPQVVIVGRANVGKSTLFNRLSDNVKAITLDFIGVTRDFLKDSISWQGKDFDLVDTGGISLAKTTEPIAKQARDIALDMIDKADLVMFVVDGKAGLVSEDIEIGRLLHKHGKSVILVINKMDVTGVEEESYVFAPLGFFDEVVISAQHGKGVADLLELIVKRLPEPKLVEGAAPAYKVTLLGKPNVGKSSLMNLLLKKERAIVSAEPGTTREALTDRVTFYQEDIQISDTPGVRRKRAVTENLEGLMVHSTMQAVKDADIVLLLVDASEGELYDQVLKLAFYAFEKQHKALMILFNKNDLVDETTQASLDHSVEEYDYFFKRLVTRNISCKTEKNVGKLLSLINDLWLRHSQKFDQNTLTQLFKEAIIHKPMYHHKKLLTVFSVHQISTAPITIVIHANFPQWFGDSELGFFENIMRKKFDLQGVPLKFIVRK